MSELFKKRSADAIVVAVDFGGELNPGETLAPSNARGTLGVVAMDSTGTDVSATLLEGAPWIVARSRAAFWLLAGAPGPNYKITVTAPTSDGELITELVELEVFA